MQPFPPASAQQNQIRGASSRPEQPRLQPGAIPTAVAVPAPTLLAGLTVYPCPPRRQ